MPGDLAPDNRNLRVSHEDRDQVAEQLRVAAGDGRLTADELDERLETALTARTYGELEVLLADLPASAGARPAPAAEAKDLVALKIAHGAIKRDGSWVVPRRLTVEARHGNVVIDFAAAVISVGHGVLRQRVHHDAGVPVKLLVTASGSLRHGNLVVRSARTGPRRSFWDWLLGRRPQTAGGLPVR